MILPSGTRVAVEELHIRPTYGGHMEGSRESVSRFILGELEEEERKGRIQLLRSPVPLPHFKCAVTLASTGSDGRPSFPSARVDVVWFTDRIPDSIGRLVEPVRLAVQFESRARSIDFDDL